MPYSIWVFNRKAISSVSPTEVLAAVTDSDYRTLCHQYGLDPRLIAPARDHLRLLGPSYGDEKFIALIYGPASQQPVMAYFFTLSDSARHELSVVLADAPKALRAILDEALEVVRIDLRSEQLGDLGLLLAYELARWAAGAGDGVVRGLDGRWYRLNRHQAFLTVGD